MRLRSQIALICILSVLCLGQNDVDILSLKKKRFRLGGLPATWSFVQSAWNASFMGTCTGGTATCAVTVTQIKPGATIIAAMATFGTSTTPAFSSISGETSTDCAACDIGSATQWQGIRYVPRATGGETSFTCTLNQTASSIKCMIIVLQWQGSTVSFDTGNALDAGLCMAGGCTGPTLTMCGGSCTLAQNAIVHLAVPNDMPLDTGVSGTGYVSTLDDGCCSFLTAAYNINTSSGSPPTWTTSDAPNDVIISGIALRGQ